jgi:hypothetical protein
MLPDLLLSHTQQVWLIGARCTRQLPRQTCQGEGNGVRPHAIPFTPLLAVPVYAIMCVKQ